MVVFRIKVRIKNKTKMWELVMKKLSIALCFVLLLLIPVSSYALLGLLKVEGAVGGWYVAPSGDLEYNRVSGVPRVDLESDLGFEEETALMGRLRFEHPVPIIPNFYVLATPMEFKGTATKNFNFNGQDFGVGTQTKLTFDQYDVTMYYGIPLLGIVSLGSLAIDVGLNVRVIDMDAEMTLGADTERVDMTIPLPMIYLAAGFNPIDMIDLEAEIRGLSVGYGGVISAIARVNVNLFGPLYVSGGYRYEDVSVDKDDFEADMKFSGPFAEVGLEF